jgi:urea transport system permease protein
MTDLANPSRNGPMPRSLPIVLLLVVLSLAWSRPGGAEAPRATAEDVTALASGGFNERIAAVDRLAATGDPRVVAVLEALLDGRLVTRSADNAVVLAEESGQVLLLREPLTGTDLGQVPRDAVSRIPINNRLRGVVRAALGGLTLLSPEASVRRQAADAVLKARPEGVEPLLVKAIERETDGGTKVRLERALAAVRLTSSTDAEVRLQALDVLAQAANQDVRALVASVLATGPDGQPLEPDGRVRDRAAEALSAIENRLALWGLVANVFQGVSLGSVLLLAAVGLAITFGVMGVINMAHGEMVMLGAYTTFVIQEVFRTHAPGAFDYSLAVALPAAFLVAALVGILIEQTVISYLYGRPLETLLATWGISLILQQTVRSLFGPTNREVGNPSWMSGAIELTGGLTLTYNRIWIIVFSLAVLVALMAAIGRTRYGLQMRAVVQNRRMAASMGIRTGRIDALTFGLGSGIAGMAGVALSQIDNVSPNLGQAYIIDSFLVVVFGGVGNLWGTLVGAMSLGLVNKFLEPYAGAVLGKIIVLVGIILFIQKRPRGLFALKGRAIEA